MDLSSIIPLLSNLTNKNNTQQSNTKNTKDNNLNGFYPDETLDGKKITIQADQHQQQNSNGLFSLLPKLLGNTNLDLSSLTNVFDGNNIFSTLLNKKENKKTNPPKISEFVKVDEYDLN